MVQQSKNLNPLRPGVDLEHSRFDDTVAILVAARSLQSTSTSVGGSLKAVRPCGWLIRTARPIEGGVLCQTMWLTSHDIGEPASGLRFWISAWLVASSRVPSLIPA